MTYGAYYNEIDPYAAQWLRNLMSCASRKLAALFHSYGMTKDAESIERAYTRAKKAVETIRKELTK